MTVAFPAAAPILAATTRNRRRPVIESPCNRICTLDPASGLCLGCGRSLDEIMRWTQMSDAERRRLIAELDRRLHKPRPAAV
jgi:predicted Fe-S protein YdhL (DUF1289 family)